MSEALHTQALAPLITLAIGPQNTLQQKRDALDHHSDLRVHLYDAGRALAAARTALEASQPPAVPSSPAPVPARSPSVRRRA